jgi:pyruvate formate lyase activating enzyme
MASFQEHGLHVALDTAGYSELEEFQSLTKLADLVLLDLKVLDPDQHRVAVGVSIEPVLRNARWLGGQATRVWIRTPVIPGFTDSPRNISAIASFIREYLPAVERWDLLGFNNLCVVKWDRLGMEFACVDTPLVTEAEMRRLVEVAHESNVPTIRWAGAVDDEASSS